MSVLRTFYRTQMRIAPAGPVVTVRWYPCPVGAKIFPHPHRFYPLLWVSRENQPGSIYPVDNAPPANPSGIGESQWTFTTCKGENPLGYLGKCFIGEPGWYVDGVPQSEIANPPALWPLCCGPSNTPPPPTPPLPPVECPLCPVQPWYWDWTAAGFINEWEVLNGFWRMGYWDELTPACTWRQDKEGIRCQVTLLFVFPDLLQVSLSIARLTPPNDFFVFNGFSDFDDGCIGPFHLPFRVFGAGQVVTEVDIESTPVP